MVTGFFFFARVEEIIWRPKDFVRQQTPLEMAWIGTK